MWCATPTARCLWYGTRSDGPGPVDRVVENRGERHDGRLHIPAPVDYHLLQPVQLRRMLVGVPDTNLHDRALRRDARIKVNEPRQPPDGWDYVCRCLLAHGVDFGEPDWVEAGARDADDGGCWQ